VSGLTPIRQLPDSQKINLCIGLPLRNPDELTSLLHDLYDPASPAYHRFLTPADFMARFAPTEQDYQTVLAFAQTNGLAVTQMHSDRRLLDISAQAADIERAFHVTLHEYRHPKENRTFYAPDTEPSVAPGLPVADIWGISDYPRPHPQNTGPQVKPLPSSATPNLGSGPGGTYRGYDFRTAYVPDATNLTGAGQSIGLFQVDGFYMNDITSYKSQAGLPGTTTIQTVLLDGFSGTPATLNGNSEVSLDIEMVLSMAPALSTVIVYEGNPANFYPAHVLSRIVSDNLARQVSSSWSWSGGPSSTLDTYFQQMAAQGQSYFQASGDSDAYLFGAMDVSANSETPVSSPYLTCVGGVTLSTDDSGNWQSDTVWNWNNGTGSSGGISSYYAIPSWQQGVNMANNQGSTTYRNIPDVALTADNIYVCYSNGWSASFGGTSCAAPLWAGFTALVNQQAAIQAMPSPVGFLNPALYAIGKGAKAASVFHDTTTGDNTSTTSPTSFYAVPGYDLCTGWGTPNGLNMIQALVPPLPYLTLVSASFNDTIGGNGNGFADPGETIFETIGWTNSYGVTATNVIATLSAGTVGVTLLQATSAYPNIPIQHAASNATPFIYRLAHTLAAGTTLVFTNILQTGTCSFTQVFSHIVGESSLGAPVTNYFAVTNTIAIPISSTVYVTNLVTTAAPSIITGVTASVRLNFSRDKYLVIATRHPDETGVMLSKENGGTGNNYGTGTPTGPATNTVFADNAGTSITTGTAPFAGTFAPNGALASFNGKTVAGAWVLCLTNTSSSRTGTFYDWGLTIVSRPIFYSTAFFNTPPVASNQSVCVAYQGTTNLILRASDANGDPLTFQIATPPTHGALSNFNTNSGAIAYSAFDGYSGTDVFSFVANDTFTNSASATVTITISPPFKGSLLLFE
jgi:subtilase family serine protease